MLERLRSASRSDPVTLLTETGARDFAFLAEFGAESGLNFHYFLLAPASGIAPAEVYIAALGADGDIYLAREDDESVISRITELYKQRQRQR